MEHINKLSAKFHEVLKHEGVVSVVSWAEGDAHIANTWNSYLMITEDERILIPAAGFRKTQRNVELNNHIKITLGSKDVLGYRDYQGTGFRVDGIAKFVTSGEEFEVMKEKFPFLSRVLEITVDKATQTI